MTGRTLALCVAATVAIAMAALVAAAPGSARAQGKSSSTRASDGALLEGVASASSGGSLIAGFDGPSGSARAIVRIEVTSRGTTPPTIEVVAWPEGGSSSKKSAIRRRELAGSMVCAMDLTPGHAVYVRCHGDAAVKWELLAIEAGGH